MVGNDLDLDTHIHIRYRVVVVLIRDKPRRRKFIHREGMELALMSIQRFVTKSVFLSRFLFFFFLKRNMSNAFTYYLGRELNIVELKFCLVFL